MRSWECAFLPRLVAFCVPAFRAVTATGCLAFACVLFSGCNKAGSNAPAAPSAPTIVATGTQSFELAATKPLTEKEITNSLGMKLVRMEPGSFTMGWDKALSDFKAHDLEEFGGPRQPVKITQPFYISAYEVTQGEYQKLMGTNPSAFHPDSKSPSGAPMAQAKFVKDLSPEVLDKMPVERISWGMAVDFCKKLSELPEEKEAGRVYTLPTEAQWEYACKGGRDSYFGVGDGASMTQGLASFAASLPFPDTAEPGKSFTFPSPVGSFEPNAWGLYDMHGNVWEWCLDSRRTLTTNEVSDPVAAEEGPQKSIRGGAFKDNGYYLLSCFRNARPKENAQFDCGIRVIIQVKQ